jgi:hypothetical protein
VLLPSALLLLQAVINASGKQGFSRDRLLAAINTLKNPAERQSTLRMHGFWRVSAAHACIAAAAAEHATLNMLLLH